MSLRSLQARWQLGEIAPESVHRAALELLQQGEETPALSDLACLYGVPDEEVARGLARAIREAALPPMTNAAARWRLAYDTADAIMGGRIPPLRGAQTLARLRHPFDTDEALGPFVEFAEGYREHDALPASERATLDAASRTAATELLRYRPPDAESPPLDRA